jgi:hypothetical protein
MSTEEYLARQRANEAQNQQVRSSTAADAIQRRVRDARQHLERARTLIDPMTNDEAYSELETGDRQASRD